MKADALVFIQSRQIKVDIDAGNWTFQAAAYIAD